jgi:pilus assembly protein CpaE
MRTLLVNENALDQVSTRLRAIVRMLVDTQGPSTVTPEEAWQAFLQQKPEMAIVVLSPNPEQGLSLLRKMRAGFTGCLLAVGEVTDSRMILRALSDGADHYLDEAELESGLEAVMARLANKQASLHPAGQLLALLSASGGCGASTLAVNIAAALAKEHQRCCLVDLKAGRGDLASLLDLKPGFNLADLCLNLSRLDRAIFDKLLVRHESGVHLLAAPQTFGDTRIVTTQGVNQALTMARRFYTHVVADLEDCFHEEQLAALRQASIILLVTRLDFTALRNARRILSHLEELELPRSRVRFVVNRHGQPNELPVADAEAALGEPLTQFVPDDPKTINLANNAGIPAVLKYSSAKVSQSLAKLARGIFERRRNPPQADAALAAASAS